MRTILLLCFLVAHLAATNNFITTNPQSVDFHQTITGNQYEEEIWIKNNTSSLLNLELTNFEEAFSVNPNDVSVSAYDSVQVSVIFSSEQNVYFEDILLITDENLSYSKGVYLSAENHYSSTFYDQTYNLYDTQLKNELTDMVDNHNSLGYIPAKEAMFGYIDNENGQVQCVYTAEWYAIPEGGMPNQDVFNCEHTWPQSMGAEGTAKSDIHHLYPTFANVNSIRGNLPFGNVVTATWQDGGSLKGYDVNNTLVFEPRDPHKGDCARSLFYFCIRYGNLSSFLTYQEPVMRNWFYEDPVSIKETNRNAAIEDYQENRNPFVDHPELLSRIFSLSTNSTTPLTYVPQFQPAQLNFGTVSLNQTITLYLTMANTGTGTLNISNININSVNYSVNVNSLQILAGDYTELPVEFNSSIVGSFPGTLSFTCSGLNYQIPLNAVVTNVSADENIIEPDFDISVFPNPINLNKNSELNIRTNSKSATNLKIEFFNIKGKKIDEYSLATASGESTSIKLNDNKNWQNGMHLCRISCGKTNLIKKVMILK